MYFFWTSSSEVVSWLSRVIGIQRFLHHQQSAVLSFLFVMGGIMFHLVLVFFYFSLFKYIFLIIGSPLFAYLSEQTEALINGKEYNFNFDRQLVADMTRGIRVALRNSLWQTVYTVSILILSFIPLIGWITPVISTFVECYYYGFSMLDYSCMRHKLTAPASLCLYQSAQRFGHRQRDGVLWHALCACPRLGACAGLCRHRSHY